MIGRLSALLVIVVGGMIIGGTGATVFFAWLTCRMERRPAPTRLRVYAVLVALAAIGWIVLPIRFILT